MFNENEHIFNDEDEYEVLEYGRVTIDGDEVFVDGSEYGVFEYNEEREGWEVFIYALDHARFFSECKEATIDMLLENLGA